MNSILNKFRKRSISKDGSSYGSNSSLHNSGVMTLSPYTINEKQLHPFLKATWRNDLSKVKKLMKKNYNQVDQDKRSGFHLACAAGNLDIMKELLSNYQNEILEKCDINNKTGLYKAVEKGILQNVTYLLDKGAKTDIKDDKGDSIIHAAIRYKHLSVLNYLLQKQVNYTDPNKDGMTPLHMAAELNFVDGMISLLDYPCGIDEKNKVGKTALIIATESGHASAVKLLLSKDADQTITDDEGYSALYYATYHEQTECMELLKNVEKFHTLKTISKVPAVPNFLGAIMPDDRNSEHSDNSYQYHINDLGVSRSVKSEKKSQGERKFTRAESVQSNNTWMGDFASTSSEATMPNFISRNDISTPSSMPNPSEVTKNQPKSYTHPNHFSKQISDDESQWSENEKHIPDEYLAPNNKSKELEKVHESKVDNGGDKISDSEWDSDDTECNDVQLSVIDEESQRKPNDTNFRRDHPLVTKKDHIDLDSSDMSFLQLPNNTEDGHQTDSNIDECLENNYIITNPPIKYDSVDELSTDSNESDGINELYNNQIARNKNKNKSVAPFAKPPKSPSVTTVDPVIPTISVQMVGEKKPKLKTNQAGGDNLSYSSTENDANSRNGSLAELDSIKDQNNAGHKSMEDYIKKCTQLESKLRTMQSEKEILHFNLNSVKEQRDKSEQERSKILKENLKLEGQLSERIDEINGYISKCDSIEQQLKKREKELFEIKQIQQNSEDQFRKLELDNIECNSKIKQLEQEMELLKSGNEKEHNDQEQILQKNLKYEKELKELKKINEELKTQISDSLQKIAEKDNHLSKADREYNLSIQELEQNIKNLKEKVKKESDEKESFQEEIDQLRKTIKNLNTDLESSNKSMALVSKQERENSGLKDQLQDLENKSSQLLIDNKNLKKTMEENDKKIHKFDLDIERLENQNSLKDDRIAQFEIKCKTVENQIQDLEKLLEKKNVELRDYEDKVINNELELKNEMKKTRNVLEMVNETINTAINDYPESPAILEKLHNIKHLISNSEKGSVKFQSTIKVDSKKNYDLSIELAKSRSQIRVLQEEIDQLKNDYRNQINHQKDIQSKYNYSTKHNINKEDVENEFEVERIDKLEKIEKMNKTELQSHTKIIQDNQIELTQLDRENLVLKESLKEEKQKHQLTLEKDKSLSIQLRNEIKKKKHLTETLDSIKYWIDKYLKQINVAAYSDINSVTSQIDEMDCVYLSIPNQCSFLLKTLSDMNEDLKLKMKKLEMENSEFNKTSDKGTGMQNENVQAVLNQQLEELTQMVETQRRNREKLEKIRDENEFQLRNELYQNKQHNMMEIAQLSNKAAMFEDDRNKLLEEIKTLNDELKKERYIKDNLTEQLLNLVKSSNGSSQQLNGYEPIVPKVNGFTNSPSQIYLPHGMSDNDRKVYANSMLNLSFTKSLGVDENELRQKLREELDRSIAKHLESGKPIRKLNIKDKIRSLHNVTWKSP